MYQSVTIVSDSQITYLLSLLLGYSCHGCTSQHKPHKLTFAFFFNVQNVVLLKSATFLFKQTSLKLFGADISNSVTSKTPSSTSPLYFV